MTSSVNPKNIILKGKPIHKEERAGGAITPGHLVAFDGSGYLVVHPTAGGNAAPAFAIEQAYLGGSIDTAYVSGNRADYVVCSPGDEIYAFLAAGQNVAKGANLESAGNGALRAHVATMTDANPAAAIQTKAVVARAVQAVNNSAGGNPVRIKVEVL